MPTALVLCLWLWWVFVGLAVASHGMAQSRQFRLQWLSVRAILFSLGLLLCRKDLAKRLGPCVVEGTFLIAGLILALQTHFEVERDKDGRWSIKIKKKATSDALLKPLIKKLTDLLGG